MINAPRRFVRFVRFVTGLLGIAALPALGGCADDAQFTVKYAPGYPRAGQTVSVFGLFKDGRMSPESWDEVAGKISTALGAASCATGYDAKLATASHSLADAIDDEARANGITDELLDLLAPAASGDLILVLTVAGRPPGPSSTTAAAATSAPTNPGRAGGRRGALGGSPGGLARAPVDRNVFEISASLFSVHDHRSVALVHMGYIGASATDALGRFAERLHTSLAGATCAGWHFADVKIDDASIEKLKDE